MSEPETGPNSEPNSELDELTTAPGWNRTVPIVVGAVVVLVVVGLVVYLLTRPDSEQAADPDVPTVSGETPPPSPPTRPSASSPATGAATSGVPGPPPAGDERAAVRTVAQNALNAVNNQDVEAMSTLACDPTSVGQQENLGPGVTATIVAEPTINGDTATVPMEVRLDGMDPIVVELNLEKRADGSWCVP